LKAKGSVVCAVAIQQRPEANRAVPAAAKIMAKGLQADSHIFLAAKVIVHGERADRRIAGPFNLTVKRVVPKEGIAGGRVAALPTDSLHRRQRPGYCEGERDDEEFAPLM